MNTSTKFKVNQTKCLKLSGQAFLSQIRGSNSVILDGIITNFGSCTSTTPNQKQICVFSDLRKALHESKTVHFYHSKKFQFRG